MVFVLRQYFFRMLIVHPPKYARTYLCIVILRGYANFFQSVHPFEFYKYVRQLSLSSSATAPPLRRAKPAACRRHENKESVFRKKGPVVPAFFLRVLLSELRETLNNFQKSRKNHLKMQKFVKFHEKL